MSIVIRPITTLPDEFIESLATSISLSQITFEPKYVAMDSDAHWCVFEDMPELDKDGNLWNNRTGKFNRLVFKGDASDLIWSRSLMEILIVSESSDDTASIVGNVFADKLLEIVKAIEQVNVDIYNIDGKIEELKNSRQQLTNRHSRLVNDMNTLNDARIIIGV